MPARLLADIIEEEKRLATRGKLKIFFGFAPGVGKTYTMLEAAQVLRARGVDVVAGWIETHGRPETEARVEGIERLSPRIVDDRGILYQEFDLDAALARRPEVLLVDELAHQNVPGMRHAHRYEDVRDLLDAGISVYTTLNVHHVESLHDVVAKVTGVLVRETIPDVEIERADDLELVDLPPDELIQRLREGKVYVNEQAQRAVAYFFRKGNLIALRELALRRAAERVDDQLRGYRHTQGIAATWAVGERIAVAVGPSPFSARLIRATRRMARPLKAEWYAVFVETPAFQHLDKVDRARLEEHLELAKRLGGTPVRRKGARIAEELISFARKENVTQIVIGKPTHPRWRDFIHGSPLDDLVRHSGDIGIYVITGEPEQKGAGRSPPPAPFPL